MYIDLIHLSFTKDFKEVGLINIALPSDNKGTRHLVAFRFEKNKERTVYTFHWLFNYNRAWWIEHEV